MDQQVWSQVYNPTGSMVLSTALAAVPIVVLLGALGILEMRAHLAAALGLLAALLVAIFGFGMPAGIGGHGRGRRGGLRAVADRLDHPQRHLPLPADQGEGRVRGPAAEHPRASRDDRRLQLLFIAFCFGAFFEGAAGFGTPVAVTAAMLIGLGFSPLAASGLSLIANTAPVAFGALGTPIIALASGDRARPATSSAPWSAGSCRSSR